MSSAERFVRHHKRQTDCTISEVYARLAADTIASETFRELLHRARNRAPRLLDAPVVNGYHPGVEALVNLARFRRAHMRAIGDWPGTPAGWRVCVSSLAEHLVCAYAVPRFLATSWYVSDGAYGESQRHWFVAHGRGASFRSLHLPIAMTRKMEHIFLMSRDHFSVEHALRRAELLALGGSAELVREVLSTRLAADLSNSEFWRTVLTFLVANAAAIDTGEDRATGRFHRRDSTRAGRRRLCRQHRHTASAAAVVLGEG